MWERTEADRPGTVELLAERRLQAVEAQDRVGGLGAFEMRLGCSERAA
jgi:hypothetical protein